ncbi:Bifunctional riboflavin kinase/FMN adenylyltransferase [Buchnera aphidicola (Thelaxes suberi)]|uniref:bifunctional riboflavin kinase/FAD synthetase n=1 Tax=Buchnera aphidicola TaxID=9 RepID=UPI003464E429
MQIINNLLNFKKITSNTVITIGNFDGMHLGHQNLIHKLNLIKTKNKFKTVVILFTPHPVEFLGTAKPIFFRINSVEEKIDFLKKYKIDFIVLIKFNHFFASLKPNDFINIFLIKKLNMKCLIVGDDFHFGFRRSGNLTLLKNKAKKNNFKILTENSIIRDNIRISSTKIRELIIQGDLKKAENFLGHPFTISGKVEHGIQKGRKIGFPTANVNLHSSLQIINGVYAVKIFIFDCKKKFFGIANIGICPTFKKKNIKLEVHIPDIFINLYEKKIKVIFIKKIRKEKKFNSINDLIIQIKKDVNLAKKIFLSYTL